MARLWHFYTNTPKEILCSNGQRLFVMLLFLVLIEYIQRIIILMKDNGTFFNQMRLKTVVDSMVPWISPPYNLLNNPSYTYFSSG